MQTQEAKERSCPHAPFRKKEWRKLIPYPGSTPHMRRTLAGTSIKKVQPRQRLALGPKIREWFVAEISAWPSDAKQPLTWDAVIAKGLVIHRWKWSRSGLCRFPEISEAFAKRTDEIRAGRRKIPRTGPRADEAKSRARLLAMIDNLREENEELTRRIRTWQRNARALNITEAQLDEGWDEVDRGQTDLDLRKEKGLSLPQHARRKAKRK
ncbi:MULTISPECIES: hypothetical protein [unclassified Methylobacterium]|uniref:hypothetical protein n=2 Tax=Methylobacterium TaxID=407 RepID=UPI000FBF4FEC|nr:MULTISPECIES: hypothetical protein [unclassified Methylobacterium]MDE4911701.1 hypothetical protein [Methylobacterium sp. 092160098-2]MDE4914952.1 hypothetical protein [Methylobacterium sp. 092160098-2]RUP15854.1 MAG: hypothetical protein EKK43_04845 [Methylobacterium sp.]